MARKFGVPNTSRIGTGKINKQELGTGKWAGSAAVQVATAAQIKGTMTKTIPVDYVVCDPENPRKLALTQEQIIQIAKKYPLDKSQLQIEEPSDWMDEYIVRVGKAEALAGKAIGDLESLVAFAAALKSADRLLHPIVVWWDESTFHLIAGERRLLVHILLGESHIAARIVENGYTRSEIGILQWEENIHRVDMTLWERVNHVKKLLEAGEGIHKSSVTKLSKILGRSRAESQRYLAVLRYPILLLLEAISDGRVTDLKMAAALAQLSPTELNSRFNSKSKSNAIKPAVKFNDESQVPQFGELIKAAAKQLKMSELIKQSDLTSAPGINTALRRLLNEMDVRSRD